MAAKKDLPTKKNMKIVQKGFKQTQADKNFRGETNWTADSARAGNLARVSAEAARKKAAKKPTAMGQAAKSHQKDLAKISGTTAAIKAGKKLPEAGRNERIGGRNAKITSTAYDKAKAKTLKSFKKSN